LKINDPTGVFAKFLMCTFHFVCLTLSFIESIATDDTLPLSKKWLASKAKVAVAKAKLAFESKFCFLLKAGFAFE
jgi:hypothetical protein